MELVRLLKIFSDEFRQCLALKGVASELARLTEDIGSQRVGLLLTSNGFNDIRWSANETDILHWVHAERDRIVRPVDGLWDLLSLEVLPQGWEARTAELPDLFDSSTRILSTEVIGRKITGERSFGQFVIAYNERSRTLELRVWYRETPHRPEDALPGWMEVGPNRIRVPTVQYWTLSALKAIWTQLHSDGSAPSAISGVETIFLHSVEHRPSVTCLQQMRQHLHDEPVRNVGGSIPIVRPATATANLLGYEVIESRLQFLGDSGPASCDLCAEMPVGPRPPRATVNIVLTVRPMV